MNNFHLGILAHVDMNLAIVYYLKGLIPCRFPRPPVGFPGIMGERARGFENVRKSISYTMNRNKDRSYKKPKDRISINLG